MMKMLCSLVLCSMAAPALAHHGVAAVSVAGTDGPGAAIETTSPLPLPARALFTLVKSENVSFQQRASAEAGDKTFSSFNTLGIGYGVLPYVAAYLFQPYNLKTQREVGRNRGLGDASVMLVLSAKYDEGLRLAPERESLDELEDLHLSAWVSSTVPLGSVTHVDDRGDFFAPDMQTGFGRPSPSVGVAAGKQLTSRLTWLADASFQHFLTHRYELTRYRFGNETRLNTALVVKILGGARGRMDALMELNGLNLQRDRERDADGIMRSLSASGGSIGYVGAGLRATYGSLGLALGLRRAALTRLNEAEDQQGAEGLERYRASLSLTYATSL